MDTAQRVAQHALAAWQVGTKTGDWSGLIALLANDVRLETPFQDAGTPTFGATAAHEYVRRIADDLKVRVDLKPISPLIGNGDRFAIELVGTGTVGGDPATVPICLWFTVSGERVSAIREYVGIRA